ncbi:MAG: hypothetical protein AAF618_01175, partial [Pseudomonadota bacterium]
MNAARERRKKRIWPLALGGTFALVLVATVALVVRLQAAPIPAGAWLTERIESEVDGLLPDVAMAFGAIRLGLDREFHPQVYLDDVTLTRADGVPLLDLRSIQSDLAIGKLIDGEVALRRVVLSGAVLLVERSADGRVDLQLGQRGAGGGAVSGSLSTAQDAFAALDRLFERPALAGLTSVTAEAISVNYADAVSGETWIGDGGQVRLFRDGAQLLLTAEAALLTGRDALAALSLSLERDGETGEGALSVVLEDFAGRDIASQAPALAWLGAVEADVSGALQADIVHGGLSDLRATLELEEGALRPNASTRPIPFSEASISLGYDPDAQRISFDEFVLDTAWGRASATGSAQLQDFRGVLPREIVGQFRVTDIAANPGGLYEAERKLEKVSLDFRLRLDPFTFDIGQAVVVDGASEAMAQGRISAGRDGWAVAVDVAAREVEVRRGLSFWPVSVRPGLRLWFENNLRAGIVEAASVAIRAKEGERPDINMTKTLREGRITLFGDVPALSDLRGSLVMQDGMLSVLIEEGKMIAPSGGTLDATGSVVHIGDLSVNPSTAEVRVKGEGPMSAVLSVLDVRPMEFLKKGGQPTNVADGAAALRGTISLPLKDGLRGRDVTVDMRAILTDVASEVLVAGKLLAMPEALVEVSNARLRISGAGTLGAVPFDGAWEQRLGADADGSVLSGTVELSQAALDEFNIALPPGSIGGIGQGALTLDLKPGVPPRFALTSDLVGLNVNIPQVSYLKPRSQAGAFEIEGRLGANPQVDRVSLSAPGLSAEGSIALRPGGVGFESATFETVRVGEWLSGALTLTSRGDGLSPAVSFRDGRLDLRRARFGTGQGAGGPLDIELRELVITEDMVVTGLNGDFDTTGGLSG